METKQTMRSATARFRMKTFTRFLRSSAQLTMVMMTDRLPSNIRLPSNVSNISSEMAERRKMIAGVQMSSFEAFSGSDVVVILFPSPFSSVTRCNGSSL